MDPAQGSGSGLEDHLRNLIVGNAQPGTSQPPPAGGLGSRPAVHAASYPADSAPYPADTAAYPADTAPYPADPTGAAQSPSDRQPMSGGGPGLGGGPPLLPPSPRASRGRRPNQAQRRQMSAQLSIPIDPRPPLHSARQYASPPAYANHQPYPGSYQKVQRPQSATFRPTYFNPATPGGPLTGVSFPAQPRHHQSLSYNGPISYNEQYDWGPQQQYRRPGDFMAQGAYPTPALFPFDAQSPSFPRALYNPNQGRMYQVNPEELKMQSDVLQGLCDNILANAEIEPADIQKKESFRVAIEGVCCRAITRFEQEVNGAADFPPSSVQLKCFGSLASGFATKAADMDLGLLSPLSKQQPDGLDSPIPRLLEKAFLDAGYGARLLTRTRVPIIKLCENPTRMLREELLKERAKWEKGVPDEAEDGVDTDEEDVNDEPELPPTAVHGRSYSGTAIPDRPFPRGGVSTPIWLPVAEIFSHLDTPGTVSASHRLTGADTAWAAGRVQARNPLAIGDGVSTADRSDGTSAPDGLPADGSFFQADNLDKISATRIPPVADRASTASRSPTGHARSAHSRGRSDLAEDSSLSQELANPEQEVGQPLIKYYTAAKRLLRKLGGRDIKQATASHFQPAELQKLTEFCHAFVHGLADEVLKARLLASVSLTPSLPNMPNVRSLYGVYMQMKGERLAMIWESREVHEKDEQQEHDGQMKVAYWKEVQNKPTFGIDPLGYNKELKTALQQMEKIPSVQIATLEQKQNEQASRYHAMTIRLLVDVGGVDLPSPENKILPVVVRQYVDGIWDAEIRSLVREFAQSANDISLRAAARRHKSLELACEFEKAIHKGFYDDKKTLSDIKAYMALLWGPLQKPGRQNHHYDYVLPRGEEVAALVQRIGLLPDPLKLAQNQPRDPHRDRLEFPPDGIGVQCDINFSAHLALHNTTLLRCYSLTDHRVRPMVLFVKHWAKVRGINTAYRGTLSSYGYVLMVLHYLVNIVHPFVCPNLQQLVRPSQQGLSPKEASETTFCRGRDVRFWRDETEIDSLARQGALNQNRDSIGHLLRGFFEYFAQNNMMSSVPCRGFDWGRDVLSLRTPGGLRSKQDKGWTGARTVMVIQNQSSPATPVAQTSPSKSPLDGEADPEVKTPVKAAPPQKGSELMEVRNRYLFAIEDPFELDHNVARTVTHNGIVAIRDEFRRAWRIIRSAGKGQPDEHLLQDSVTDNRGRNYRPQDLLLDLVRELHGPEGDFSA